MKRKDLILHRMITTKNNKPKITMVSTKKVKYIGIQFKVLLFHCPMIDKIGLDNSTANLHWG